jgi:protocatechuate 3,4-dioxygenase beta subunit
MTPEAVEGPFYFDPALLRTDITEGKPGIPLRLKVQVIEGATCRPIKDARVDIWHADATGHYSGYDRQGDDGRVSTKGLKFLRGTQMTSSVGEVTFRTIYPGWYRGRTAHIHIKVYLDETSVLTGQLYFPDALSEYIYTAVTPYTERSSKRDTLNSTDFIAQGDKENASFLAIKEEADAYVASVVIGVDRDAKPAMPGRGPDGPPPGPPPGAGGPPPPGPLRATGRIVPGRDS